MEGLLSDTGNVGSRMKRKLLSQAVSQVKTLAWSTDALGITHSMAQSSLVQGARLCTPHELLLAIVTCRHPREELLLSARAAPREGHRASLWPSLQRSWQLGWERWPLTRLCSVFHSWLPLLSNRPNILTSLKLLWEPQNRNSRPGSGKSRDRTVWLHGFRAVVCPSQPVSAHKSPLLNFQELCKLVVKHSHYLKLNYITSQLNNYIEE